jgi:hypothetical protein
MTEEPTVKNAEPESPANSSESNPPLAGDSARSAWTARVTANPPAAARRRRPRWKKILVPIGLAAFAAAFIMFAFHYYPRRGDVTPAPAGYVAVGASSPGCSGHAPSRCLIASARATRYVYRHIADVEYIVTRPRPGLSRVHVHIALDISLAAAYQGFTLPGWYARRVIPPNSAVIVEIGGAGVTSRVIRCWPGCSPVPTSTDGSIQGFALATAYFNRRDDQYSEAPIGGASASFDIKGGSFGVATNGATAAVTLPQVNYEGAHQASVIITYPVSAKSYDWSSSPAQATKTTGEWDEFTGNTGSLAQLREALTNTQVVTGVNHAAHAHDNLAIFVAGILFGVGGSALVAAFQEALHD